MISHFRQSILFCLFAAGATTNVTLPKEPASPLHWNWQELDEITAEKTLEYLRSFPENFLWGASTSSHQVEGDCTNNTWSAWENELDNDGNLAHVTAQSGIACDHWNRYKKDIQLLKNIGATSYRFSIEWSKVEPKPGKFDKKVLKHYKEVCKELVKNGIKPFVNLHHYTDPLWFANIGGFEKTENIGYYVRYGVKVFEALKDYNPMLLTFNSPSGYSSKGWLAGMAPPAEKDMQLATEVLKNLLEAHVQVYHAIKAQPGGDQIQIGTLKNIFQLDPWQPWNPLDQLACAIGNRIVNGCMYDFFKTGDFNVHIPGLVNVKYHNPDAPQALDFIGLNYYGHNYMNFFKRFRHPDEMKVGNDRYTVYAEGLYRAIQELSDNVARPTDSNRSLIRDIPIYVTENGVASPNNEEGNQLRDLFLKRYLYALSKAIKDGYNVRGYMHWSLMDNYEWGSYGKKAYGIYHVDFDTQERTLKPGAQHYLDVIETYNTRTYY